METSNLASHRRPDGRSIRRLSRGRSRLQRRGARVLIGLLATVSAQDDDDEWSAEWDDPRTPRVWQRRFSKVRRAFDWTELARASWQDLERSEANGTQKGVSALLIDCPGVETLKKNAAVVKAEPE